MAGILNFTPTPNFRTLSPRKATIDRVFFLKSPAKASDIPLTASISAPANFKAPQPKPFSIRPDKVLDILSATFASLFCITTSLFVSGNGPNFHPKVSQMGGKQQFPYVVDPNAGVSMDESDDIIKYWAGKYGDGNVPLLLSLGPLTTFTQGFVVDWSIGEVEGWLAYLQTHRLVSLKDCISICASVQSQMLSYRKCRQEFLIFLREYDIGFFLHSIKNCRLSLLRFGHMRLHHFAKLCVKYLLS